MNRCAAGERSVSSSARPRSRCSVRCCSPRARARRRTDDLPGPADPALSRRGRSALDGERRRLPLDNGAPPCDGPLGSEQDAAVVDAARAQDARGTANPLQVLGRTRDAAGRVWVRTRLAVLPNGTTGWVPRTRSRGIACAHATRRQPPPQARDALARRPAGPACPGGHRPAAVADTARALLRAQQARALPQPLRPARLRDERALGRADGLAGRRFRRHPRDGPAATYPGPRFARLHQDAKLRHRATRPVDAVGTITIN